MNNVMKNVEIIDFENGQSIRNPKELYATLIPYEKLIFSVKQLPQSLSSYLPPRVYLTPRRAANALASRAKVCARAMLATALPRTFLHSTLPMTGQAYGTTTAEPTTCACRRDITFAELRKIAPEADEDTLTTYLKAFNAGFAKYGMTTCREKAHFLAQCCHESMGLVYTAEIGGSQKSYAPWYGRGLIQLTFEKNYRAYGSAVGEDVYSSEDNRNKLTTSPHCVTSAFWFYMDYGNQNLDSYAKKDDFNMITARINGGFNGYDDRLRYFDKAVEVLRCEHLNQLRKEKGFTFEESAIYNNKVYAYSWGRYHDPLSQEQGTRKDKVEALVAYKRALALYQAAKDTAKVSAIQTRINRLS
ncbi:glycoside hydrolase family 19 protein [Lonsdalea britannica]|uniref:glycoside hydrolase family 19 protein n=1 Tax=Lonsdalea britannica TaxID=1082704 RepID=UPI0026F2A0E3|nr:glycoside hydrolase family 19 protein [Lonsdalea britannica]